MSLKMAVLTIAAPILAGCATTGPIEGPVRLGQVAYVNGPRVRVKQVIEDSRCPVDVQCVWAGRLVVRATVLGGGWSRQIDLTLGIPVTVADGSLMLVEATPVRMSKPQIEPLLYRFTFSFSGGI